MGMAFPQSLLREVLDISIENGCKCSLKITISGAFEDSPIEKTWDITLESIYSTKYYSFENLPGNVELSVDVEILLDDKVYYKSKKRRHFKSCYFQDLKCAGIYEKALKMIFHRCPEHKVIRKFHFFESHKNFLLFAIIQN